MADTALEVVELSYGYTRAVKALDKVSFAVPPRRIHGPTRPERCRQDHADGADHPAVLRPGRPRSWSAATIWPPNRARRWRPWAWSSSDLRSTSISRWTQNLRYAAALQGLASPAARIGEVLSRLGLTDRADSKVRTLSGGMKRRARSPAPCCIGRSLLVLDEPTVGLDIDSRRDIVRARAPAVPRGGPGGAVGHALDRRDRTGRPRGPAQPRSGPRNRHHRPRWCKLPVPRDLGVAYQQLTATVAA